MNTMSFTFRSFLFYSLLFFLALPLGNISLSDAVVVSGDWSSALSAWLSSRQFLITLISAVVSGLITVGFLRFYMKKKGFSSSVLRDANRLFARNGAITTPLSPDEAMEAVKKSFGGRAKRLDDHRMEITSHMTFWYWSYKTVLTLIPPRSHGNTRVSIAFRRWLPVMLSVDFGSRMMMCTLSRLLTLSAVEHAPLSSPAKTMEGGVRSIVRPNALTAFLRYFIAIWVYLLPLPIVVKIFSGHEWTHPAVLGSAVLGLVYAVFLGLIVVIFGAYRWGSTSWNKTVGGL